MRGRVLVVVVLAAACATSPPASKHTESAGAVPGWLAVGGLAHAPELDEAAAALCARDGDSVVDDQIRHAAHIHDGAVVGLMRTSLDENDAKGQVAARAGGLLGGLRATHVGTVVGKTPRGEACAAFVAVRRTLTLDAALPEHLNQAAPIPLRAHVAKDAVRARVFLMGPDGMVTTDEVAIENGALRDAIVPKRGPGIYVVEVLVDDGKEPQVALLWPFVVGEARQPPIPEVLFPDEGHPDEALSRRGEALVVRLRDMLQLEPVKVWPVLSRVATARAMSIAQGGSLAHRREGATPLDDVKREAPDAALSKVSEVQAVGANLSEAWTAMVQSPAHRYELVDPTSTHMGVAVARGVDGAGRPLVSLVVMFVRKPVERDPAASEEMLLTGIDDARTARGLEPLVRSKRLDRLAERLVDHMAGRGVVDEAGLGEPVARMALQDDASLTEVKPVVARLDDPLHLEVPTGALEIDMSSVGLGIARGEKDHLWYVVLLLGVGGT